MRSLLRILRKPRERVFCTLPYAQLHRAPFNLRVLRNSRKIIRIMRKSNTLDALFPEVRQRLLAVVLLHPEKWFYMSHLAELTKLTPSSLQRELARMVSVGILETRADGNRVYYKANPRCQILPELQGLFVKTTGIVDVIKQALRPISKRIQVAFVFGSFARSSELVNSDLDLMLIGDVGLADTAPLLRKVEDEIAREVNPVILSVAEAREKLTAKQHFIESVKTASKLYLWGQDSELGKAFS
jgi:predicted nucleotidyltransferase